MPMSVMRTRWLAAEIECDVFFYSLCVSVSGRLVRPWVKSVALEVGAAIWRVLVANCGVAVARSGSSSETIRST